ncbi:hypothetical protein OAC91_00895 [Candidatus Marinimicrobia bacterium]|nr:hypothetical protein [Candidatus Neomarinimicrobiota bacterium]
MPELLALSSVITSTVAVKTAPSKTSSCPRLISFCSKLASGIEVYNVCP